MTFAIIYKHITDKCPQLATKNTYTIHEWVASGYDANKDVLPAVDESCKRGTKSIYSFSFFTQAIKRQNEKRIKDDAQPKQITIERKAEIHAWKRTRGLQYDKSFLDEYETEHGRVNA